MYQSLYPNDFKLQVIFFYYVRKKATACIDRVNIIRAFPSPRPRVAPTVLVIAVFYRGVGCVR